MDLCRGPPAQEYASVLCQTFNDITFAPVEEQAQTLDDTLGKKFGPYSRSCLSALVCEF